MPIYDRAVAMKLLRTPDADTEGLPGYPFAANYLNVGDADEGPVRMHFVDQGPRSGPVMLLLHGEPSWSYLYRKMIPPLAAAGMRCIAPDLIGFGRSDQPHKIIRDAGHFIQEDAGEELADELIKWLL